MLCLHTGGVRLACGGRGDKIQVRLDIGPQVVELVINVRKQKQMGGVWDSTGLIMLQSTVMMSIWARMEVTCDV